MSGISLRQLWFTLVLLIGFASTTTVADTVTALRSENPLVITTVSPDGCYTSGHIFRVSGSGFGSSNSQSLVLKVSGGDIQVAITKWSEKNNYISAKLPVSDSLSPGKRYPLVIIEKRTKRIISNRDKLITICPEKSVSIAESRPLLESRNNPSATEREPVYTQQENDYAEPRQTPASGSLIGGLPQPSFIPVINDNDDAGYEQGELVVISQDMKKAQLLASMAAEQGYRIKRRSILKSLGFVISVIGLPKGTKIATALQQFQQIDKALLIDANHRYSLQAATRDKNSPKVHKSIGWGKVNRHCGKNLKIGIVDSLADASFTGFRSNQVINKSFLPLGIKAADKEHATAIASIIASQPDSSVMGLLPAAKVYVAGVFRKNTNDQIDTTAELIIKGLNWLYSQRVHAINISIAGPRNLLMDLSFKRLLDKNILIAASVGNQGLENVAMYPAAINGVVGVTAVDSRNRIYGQANRGDFVQVAAPGVDIWAARGERGQAYLSGTSYATPYVTAALAVLRQKNMTMPGRQIVAQLIEKTKDLGKIGTDITYGRGLLQFTGCF